MLRDIGFLEEAANGNFTFAVFHILGPSIASLDEIADAASYLNGTHHFLVKNYINNATFFDWDPATSSNYKKIKGAQEITIPQLNELACEQVELAGLPFVSFVANKTAKGDAADFSFVLRGYVRHWLNNVWAEFDQAGVADLVSQRAAEPEAAKDSDTDKAAPQKQKQKVA
jgi:hypothetical protein